MLRRFFPDRHKERFRFEGEKKHRMSLLDKAFTEGGYELAASGD